MINCRRPSNRSSSITLPLGPSNSYFFSTAIHGIRRRSAASASRACIKAFSFTSSCWRAASHSCCDTIGGVFIARCSSPCSLSLSLLVAIFFLLLKIFLSFALRRWSYEPGGSRDQKQSFPNYHVSNDPRHTLSARYETFGADGGGHGRHRSQVHDSDYQEHHCQTRATVAAVEAQAQAMPPRRSRVRCQRTAVHVCLPATG